MSEVVNAKIIGTTLGIEDHGILTCQLHLEWPGAGISFGGYALDKWDDKKKKRIGVGIGLEFIQRVMEVVGVEKWEDIKGKYVRLDTEGWGGKALGIGNLLEEDWLYPGQFFIEKEAEVKNDR